VTARTVVEMVRENLAAKRITIDRFQGLIELLGQTDPLTRRMLEGIVGVEEAHAEELLDLLQQDSRAV
jgi:bacterioferritin